MERDDTYERAKAQAFDFFDVGFHFSGEHTLRRDELHERLTWDDRDSNSDALSSGKF